ncbi:MBL fold metallo-hydrolase [Saccharomonospora piscinae]|uniref:MBL fold metallo-hydrolase n=1 Tax=Saccharomonospora piscinae TaxID=687388 RepID=UPI001105CFFE|nr:MBL fold metallo-hydrolase [Saccharomonospora piscinae]TLW91153.1 MBL fold metallo-hydrolase [Saccharomonospora piscinae]
MTETVPAPRWRELAPGVFTRRYAGWDLSVGLVVGAARCLVVDTREGPDEGAELAAAVREITSLPWSVVLTHDHFDHADGLPAFLPCEVWAHPACAAALRERDRAVPDYRPVDGRVELDLGGRSVVLDHPGAAHSRGDVYVHVPGTGVVFAGDLVEHVPGGSFGTESFGADTTLAGWPPALTRLLGLAPHTVVPGHGEVVGPGFLARCRHELRLLLDLHHAVRNGELSPDAAAARSRLPADVTVAALAAPG